MLVKKLLKSNHVTQEKDEPSKEQCAAACRDGIFRRNYGFFSVIKVTRMGRKTNVWVLENIKPEWTLQSKVTRQL